MNLSQFLNPKRAPQESVEAYRVRRCSANFYCKDSTIKPFYNPYAHAYMIDNVIKFIPYIKEV